ncbi:MAG: hypothetical protein KF819_32415 [Labilithrix sp.]|nr:hypothetical protein [Labilithrix sp.]
MDLEIARGGLCGRGVAGDDEAEDMARDRRLDPALTRSPQQAFGLRDVDAIALVQPVEQPRARRTDPVGAQRRAYLPYFAQTS